MSKLILSNNVNYEEPKDSIKLQTSIGEDIPNYQTKHLSQFEINTFDLIARKYPLVQFKGQPTAMYNCHGFTFASKRTNIHPRDIRKILSDDSYVRINDKVGILPGDIVLYVSNDGSGDIPHTGMVVHIENNGMKIIWVLGKWGKYKEAIHPLWQCEYDNCTLEFWRNNHGFIKAE